MGELSKLYLCIYILRDKKFQCMLTFVLTCVVTCAVFDFTDVADNAAVLTGTIVTFIL